MSVFSSLLKKPIQLIEHKIELAKQEAKTELSVVLAKLVVLLTIGFLILLAIALGSIGLSNYINFKIDHPYFGYLWVGLGYFLIAVILYILNKTGALKDLMKGFSNRLVFGKDSAE